MELDADRCYAAIKSRDARFDGHFFIGVHTTGIYCRPVCPARTPKRANVQFYRHPAEAEAAGLRPCLRCRPETAPGTPAWNGTSATVARALRLINENLAEDLDLGTLAARLGVGDRHLRRLFNEHLGASPVAVAQSYRVQLAKRLLTDSTLPVTDIAFASGFQSVRRFNYVFKTTYGIAPRDIRRKLGNGDAAASGLTIPLAYRAPYDANQIFHYLHSRAFPGVEAVTGGVYRRIVHLDGCTGMLSVEPDSTRYRLMLTVEPSLVPVLPQVLERVRRMFDLHADPMSIRSALESDPALGPLVGRRPGLRLPGSWDPFETAIRAILGQQVSVKAANTLARRLVEKYGTPVPDHEAVGLTRTFPTPDRLSRARLETIGIMAARANTIRVLAREIARGEVALLPGQPLETLVEQLDALPGIGPWTAHYVAMRGFSEPDAFPIDDLGLIKALERAEGNIVKGKRLWERAEAWRPWRAYACMHLWWSLSDIYEDPGP